MSIRVKFKCMYKEELTYGNSINMIPVMEGSEENDRFFKCTPSGDLQLNLISNGAADQIEEGKEYYIDISPAE